MPKDDFEMLQVSLQNCISISTWIFIHNTQKHKLRYRQKIDISECKVHEPERNDSLWYVHKYNTLIWKPVIRVPNKLYSKNQNFKVLGRLKLQDLFSNLTQCK